MTNSSRRLIASVFLFLAAAPAAAQQPDYALDTLEVHVGSRITDALPVATRAVEVFTASEIARIPARNVKDVLGWLLGVSVRHRSPAQADLTIRGSSSEQVLVLVDGMRVSDTQTGHFDLDLAIPLAEIQRIEVLRGPASALYGTDAVGGVINVVTRRAREDDLGMAARLRGGSFGTAGGGVSVYAGDDGRGFRVSGEYRRSDGHRAGTDYRLWKTRAAGHFELAGGVLRGHLAYAARDFGARFFYTDTSSTFDEYEETRTFTGSLAWRPPENAALEIEPRLSVRRHHDDFVLFRNDPSIYQNIHTTWQLGGELVTRYELSPEFRIAVGAEAFRDILDSNALGNREETRAAAFAELAGGRAGFATVTAGLRTDWHSTFGTFVAPSLAGSIRPLHSLRLRASVGRAFRAPTWTDRYYVSPENVGNPDLKLEKTRSAEVGLDYYPGSQIQFSLSGFLRDAENLIDWSKSVSAPDSATWIARNIANATFRGLEFKAEFHDVLGATWTGRASFISFEADSTAAGFESKYALRPLTRSLSLTVRRPVFESIQTSARITHARRPGDAPYTTGAARVSYTYEGIRVYLDVTNIAAESYLDVSSVPVPGRAFYVGMQWRSP